jgi:hypothetical protein
VFHVHDDEERDSAIQEIQSGEWPLFSVSLEMERWMLKERWMLTDEDAV